MKSSVSFIQPMFHFIEKPRPPRFVGRVTPGHDVDSSATVTMPGAALCAVAFISCRNCTARRLAPAGKWGGAPPPPGGGKDVEKNVPAPPRSPPQAVHVELLEPVQ